MDDVLIQNFIRLISVNTGLHVREQDKQDLSKKLHARMKLLNLSIPEQYYQLLNTTTSQGNSPGTHSAAISWTNGKREREWQELTSLLTIGETYFFRDRGQFSLLANRILPELIASKQTKAERSLRIWSAGCSTGEEAYSLAILTKELIPDWDRWNILILGTDINSQFIEKAKRGMYDSWSFRMVEPKLKQRYFIQRQKNWEVDGQVRRMVKFQVGNLLIDPFPSFTSHIHNIDIILCRNVFIYFEAQTISVVLNKFYNTLSPGGYLIAGHTELQGQNLGQLQAKVFPESVVYRRGEEKLCESSDLSSSNPQHKQQDYANSKSVQQRSPVIAISLKNIKQITPSQTATSNVQSIHSTSASTLRLTEENLTDKKFQTALSKAEALFKDGAYKSAIEEVEQVIKQHPKHFDAYYLMAQAFANLGKSKQATECCQEAIKIDATSVGPYYLLAHIAEEQGDREKAKDLFKKIIYLAPSSIAAYLEIGELYENEGNIVKARKMWNTALEMLKSSPNDAVIEYQEGIVVSELVVYIKKLLNGSPEAAPAVRPRKLKRQ